jgi:competence protein ComEA
MPYGSQPARSLRKTALLAGVSLLLAVHSAAAAADDKPKLPEGAGKATTVKLCAVCHAAEIVMNRRESVDGWNAIIVDMIARGAKGSDDEFGEIVDYLVANFPKTAASTKINVNQASAKELTAALEIAEKQGTAIVEYRDSKGKFKSIEDLLRVPGIDTAAIEAKKSKLEF